MRHRKVKGKISRRTSWRKATLKSLTNDLITFERIETTLAKAKALRRFAEPLITMAKKDDSITARRRAFAKLCNKTVVKKLFDNVAPLFKEIPGGYTRIMASSTRKGDGAQLAIIELTQRTISDDDLLGKKEDNKPKSKKTDKKKDVKSKEVEKDKKKVVKTSKKAKVQSKVTEDTPKSDADKKEERVIDDNKKDKTRAGQKNTSKKGIFKRFRRKSI